ncbi:MAG: FAD:protein FMN transferase [Candidatus Omnitrophica bacterium]|nr:FAD:protein FMN transferase [Candidatus Omnitrophota bacterium]
MRKYLLAFLVIGWGLIFIHQLKKPARLYHDNRVLMGTFWEVISEDKKAGAVVFSEVSRIEQLLSKYVESSEISRLNRSGRLKVSPDTFYVIKRSKEFWQITGGSFDITVGPLIDLWGFNNRQYTVPEEKRISSALKLVGADKIILREKDHMVEFKLPGMKIDLGGIAKGYALDQAVKKLKENNINSCLINAGGQVYALGKRSGRPWKTGIKKARAGRFSRKLEMTNQSVSTSGDYEQFFSRDGKRYSHILDPRTGYPASSGLVSVTVVAPSGTEADALSTSAFILGKEGVDRLIKQFPKARFYIQENQAGKKS